MNNSLLLIGLGLLVAMIKVAIEYPYRKNGEKKYHDVSLAVIFCISVFIFVVTDYNYLSVVLFLLSYWNLFELSANYFHNEDIFNVGTTAHFDRLLRRITKRYEVLKFVLHLLSLIIIICILYV